MARTDYYANLYDEPGHWAGKGAERLGFRGQVEAKVLQNGFDGYSPDGTTKLVQNAESPDRQRAIDMVMTPPKSSLRCTERGHRPRNGRLCGDSTIGGG